MTKILELIQRLLRPTPRPELIPIPVRRPNGR